MMDTQALSVKDAEAFLAKFDRHYKAPVEPICAIGVAENGELHGAVILGRNADGDGELAHVYCDGTLRSKHGLVIAITKCPASIACFTNL